MKEQERYFGTFAGSNPSASYLEVGKEYAMYLRGGNLHILSPSSTYNTTKVIDVKSSYDGKSTVIETINRKYIFDNLREG